MKFTVLFACFFLMASAQARHTGTGISDMNNPFDVLLHDAENPNDDFEHDDWIDELERTTTAKPHVPIDIGVVHHGGNGLGVHEDSTTAQPTEEPAGTTTDRPNSTTAQPTEGPEGTTTEQPTEGPSGSTTDEPSGTTTTEQPTEGPSGSTTDGPSSTTTEQPTEGPTGSTTSQPTEGPTDQPTTTDGPTDGPTEGPTTTSKPDATTQPSAEQPAAAGWSTGQIAGVVIGSLFGAAILVGGILFASHKMKSRNGDRRPLVEA